MQGTVRYLHRGRVETLTDIDPTLTVLRYLREPRVPAVETLIFIGAVETALAQPPFGHRLVCLPEIVEQDLRARKRRERIADYRVRAMGLMPWNLSLKILEHLNQLFQNLLVPGFEPGQLPFIHRAQGVQHGLAHSGGQ